MKLDNEVDFEKIKNRNLNPDDFESIPWDLRMDIMGVITDMIYIKVKDTFYCITKSYSSDGVYLMDLLYFKSVDHIKTVNSWYIPFNLPIGTSEEASFGDESDSFDFDDRFYNKILNYHKKVKHLESGKVFETQKEASEYAGVNKQTVSKHCNNRVQEKNIRFKYVYE